MSPERTLFYVFKNLVSSPRKRIWCSGATLLWEDWLSRGRVGRLHLDPGPLWTLLPYQHWQPFIEDRRDYHFLAFICGWSSSRQHCKISGNAAAPRGETVAGSSVTSQNYLTGGVKAEVYPCGGLTQLMLSPLHPSILVLVISLCSSSASWTYREKSISFLSPR